MYRLQNLNMVDRSLIERRQFLAVSAAMLMMPGELLAKSELAAAKEGLSWTDFLSAMQSLSVTVKSDPGQIPDVAETGRKLMAQLDVSAVEFEQAIEASWESGNRYWLWQRLVKQADMKGGILNISRTEMVPLHDHPGATGMVRILRGEVEVWQYDLPDSVEDDDELVLRRSVRAVLKPGDTAVLRPRAGNIHGLQALTEDCAMLDFFIPPFHRPQRHWYKPAHDGWKDTEKVVCQRISEQDFQFT